MLEKVPGELHGKLKLEKVPFDACWQNNTIYALWRMLAKCCDLRTLTHVGEMSRFTHFARHKISAARHPQLFCTPASGEESIFPSNLPLIPAPAAATVSSSLSQLARSARATRYIYSWRSEAPLDSTCLWEPKWHHLLTNTEGGLVWGERHKVILSGRASCCPVSTGCWTWLTWGNLIGIIDQSKWNIQGKVNR